jgi:protein required for attachment to host cells
MPKTWIVIADATRARIFERDGADGHLTEVTGLTHAASRLRSRELGRDHAGRQEPYRGSSGPATFTPQTDPQEREHERFAQELAQMLNRAVEEHRCGQILLASTDRFLGVLRTHLHAHTLAVISQTLHHDYTRLGMREIEERLHTLRA